MSLTINRKDPKPTPIESLATEDYSNNRATWKRSADDIYIEVYNAQTEERRLDFFINGPDVPAFVESLAQFVSDTNRPF